MKITFLSLLLFTCIFIGKANAQVGYIITQKGDTAKGEYKNSAFGRPKFKSVNAIEYRSVNLDTIREYQLTKDSAIYIAKKVISIFSDRPQFVRWIERGKINLYEQVTGNNIKIITWYANKNTDSLIAIKTTDVFLEGGGSKKSRKDALSDMFADQPDVQAAFNAEGKFDFVTIMVYIRRYNRSATTQPR